MAKTTAVAPNQYTLDPRKELFCTLYFDPKSSSFGNVMRSAINAGFEQTYAQNMTAKDKIPQWFKDKKQEMKELYGMKAQRNIQKFLDIETLVPAMGAFGPIMVATGKTIIKKKKLKNGKTKITRVAEKAPVLIQNGKLLEIQQKTTHFVAEHLEDDYKPDPEAPVAPNSILNITQIIINPPQKA